MTLTRKKILFIMHMPPPVHGAAMVGKYIYDSELINSEFECSFVNLAIASSLEDIGHLDLSKIGRFLKLLYEIASKVRSFNPDLVYVTPNSKGGAFYKEYVIVQLLKMLGMKIVVHYHNKGVRSMQHRFHYNLLYKSFFKKLKVILLADCLYNDVECYVKKEDVQICPNGIPQSVDMKENRQERNSVPNIFYLSNMMVAKGVWDLLDACAELKKRGVVFVLNMVGGWKDIQPEAFKKRVEELALNDYVVAHGPVYGNDKEPFWQKADVFVLPTHDECFPLVLLEAMQHGLPCVASNVGGVSAIVESGKTGFVVPMKEPVLLADTLERMVMSVETCREMGKESRKKYDREFTLESFENKFVQCINHVLV